MDLLFWQRKPIPEQLPREVTKLVEQVKASPSQAEALATAHCLLSQRYRGYRGQTYVRLPQLFRTPAQVLASEPGFLHCTHVNYLLTVLLERSGWFKPDDIRYRWTLVFGVSPHQYVEVQVDGLWVPVDTWGVAYGIKLGDYAHWFHVGRLW